jgi:Methyl-CpG binding domain
MYPGGSGSGGWPAGNFPPQQPQQPQTSNIAASAPSTNGSNHSRQVDGFGNGSAMVFPTAGPFSAAMLPQQPYMIGGVPPMSNPMFPTTTTSMATQFNPLSFMAMNNQHANFRPPGNFSPPANMSQLNQTIHSTVPISSFPMQHHAPMGMNSYNFGNLNNNNLSASFKRPASVDLSVAMNAVEMFNKRPRHEADQAAVGKIEAASTGTGERQEKTENVLEPTKPPVPATPEAPAVAKISPSADSTDILKIPPTTVVAAPAPLPPPPDFLNKRIARVFRVKSTNRQHQKLGYVHKIFFGTVVSNHYLQRGVEASSSKKKEKKTKQMANTEEIPEQYSWHILYDDGDEGVLNLDAMKRSRKYYDDNSFFDRRKVLAVRSDEEDNDDEGDAADDDYVESDLDESPKPETPAVATNNKTKTARKPTASNNPKEKSKDNPKLKGEATAPREPPKMIFEGPPDEHINGGWPEGWMKRTFERKGGATKGQTDRYWYTPKNKYKLRSMAEVARFISALEQRNGDENAAWKLFKVK